MRNDYRTGSSVTEMLINRPPVDATRGEEEERKAPYAGQDSRRKGGNQP